CQPQGPRPREHSRDAVLHVGDGDDLPGRRDHLWASERSRGLPGRLAALERRRALRVHRSHRHARPVADLHGDDEGRCRNRRTDDLRPAVDGDGARGAVLRRLAGPYRACGCRDHHRRGAVPLVAGASGRRGGAGLTPPDGRKHPAAACSAIGYGRKAIRYTPLAPALLLLAAPLSAQDQPRFPVWMAGGWSIIMVTGPSTNPGKIPLGKDIKRAATAKG